MVYPQVADRGNNLHIWSIDANIVNKKSQTAIKGWSSRWGFGFRITTPHHKETICYKKLHRILDGFFGMT
jgi:hypothetical protein